MKRPLLISVVVVVAAALLVAGYFAGRRQPTSASITTHPSGATPEASGEVLYWYDPMMPEQHFDKPGLSPMGMEMVPRYASSGVAADVVQIDPAIVQNLGVRTARVERRTLSRTVTVPATVTWDLRQASTISARVDAVITRLQVRAPYTMVSAGEPLAELLAPQWNSALAEYEALQGAQSAEGKALRGAARQRLEVLGLSAADIRSARAGRGSAITLHAPQTGMVTALEVREGQRVGAGQPLMTVNGLDSVWIEAALPQAVAGTVHRNTPVTVRLDAIPGQTFAGTVETLLPDIDSATRTQRARIVLANPQGRLSPGMFATVQLSPAGGEALPVVPDDALIATGQQTRVIVAEGEGHFRPRVVSTGRSADGYTEILEGLHGGEKIVVSGQFLIDSEASLSGALERMGEEVDAPAAASSAAEHAQHTMAHPMPSGEHP